MKPQLLRMALIFSLLINAGVLGAAAYRGLMADSFPGLPGHLGLSPAQFSEAQGRAEKLKVPSPATAAVTAMLK